MVIKKGRLTKKILHLGHLLLEFLRNVVKLLVNLIKIRKWLKVEHSQPDEEKVHQADVRGRILTWGGKPVSYHRCAGLFCGLKEVNKFISYKMEKVML